MQLWKKSAESVGMGCKHVVKLGEHVEQASTHHRPPNAVLRPHARRMGSLRVGMMISVTSTVLLLSGTSIESVVVVVERSTKGRSTELTPHHPFKQLERVRKREHVKRVWMVGVLMMASWVHRWMMVIVTAKG
jgi:hypothetical protein